LAVACDIGVKAIAAVQAVVAACSGHASEDETLVANHSPEAYGLGGTIAGHGVAVALQAVVTSPRLPSPSTQESEVTAAVESETAPASTPKIDSLLGALAPLAKRYRSTWSARDAAPHAATSADEATTNAMVAKKDGSLVGGGCPGRARPSSLGACAGSPVGARTIASATSPTLAGDQGEIVDTLDLRLKKAALRRRRDQRAEGGGRYIKVLVDIAGLKLDLECLSSAVVADGGHHRGVDRSALHRRTTERNPTSVA
jgi:hypothetical protein